MRPAGGVFHFVRSGIHSRAHAILLLAGANLTLVQYAALRELGWLVGSNEIVLVLLLAAYFLGLSVGYLVSDRLGPKALFRIGVATVALFATLPFSIRFGAGALAALGLGGLLLPLLFVLVLLGLSPFYALFLPRLVAATSEDAAASLARLYALEIVGGLLGLALVVGVTPARMPILLAAHLAGLVTLVVLARGGSARQVGVVLVLPLAYLAAFHALDSASLSFFYRHRHNFKTPLIVASEFSPYQRVDLVKEGPRADDRIYLYLNGNLLYGSRRLNEHNLFVSILPNLVLGRPSGRALVVGGGSLDSARFLVPRVGKLTVCEIDEAVTRLARIHVQGPRGAFPENWQLVIDDGKHFLGAYQGEPFDVISVDIPVPTYLQTAMLHSEGFFRLARSRLGPGGIFSISLSGNYSRRDPQKGILAESFLANRVAAGLLRVFPHVAVVKVGRNSYAWAGTEPLESATERIDDRLRAFLDEADAHAFSRPSAVVLMDPEDVRSFAEPFAPIGDADMQIVLRMSVQKLYRRFYEPD
jgi:predicted membrane-bound spermidine synthase